MELEHYPIIQSKPHLTPNIELSLSDCQLQYSQLPTTPSRTPLTSLCSAYQLLTIESFGVLAILLDLYSIESAPSQIHTIDTTMMMMRKTTVTNLPSRGIVPTTTMAVAALVVVAVVLLTTPTSVAALDCIQCGEYNDDGVGAITPCLNYSDALAHRYLKKCPRTAHKFCIVSVIGYGAKCLMRFDWNWDLMWSCFKSGYLTALNFIYCNWLCV